MKNEIKKQIPGMLMGEELDTALQILPKYDRTIPLCSASERLIALQDVYQLFIPNQMSREIYSKMYLALLRSLQKKQSILAVRQFNANSRIPRKESFESIIGGADSFTIIGQSGIGKSSAVSRSVRLLMKEPYFELNSSRIIPCLTVQAPADCSIKGLLFEILRKADEALGTTYYTHAIRSRATADILIGSVSQVALNHIGLLIIDEIQNVVNSKTGRTIIGTLTQLINNSGVSVCMIGTPESTLFFDQAMMLARRTIGLQYGPMEYGEEFQCFCDILFRYSYVRESAFSPAGLGLWLYQHSSGNAGVVISLYHDAQEIAILSGREKMDTAALNLAYEKRLAMLHDYVGPEKVTLSLPKKQEAILQQEEPADVHEPDEEEGNTIRKAMMAARKCKRSMIDELRQLGIPVQEVAV